MERMTAEEYRREIEKRPTKYGNKKVKLDGHTFDSQAEANYYCELKILQRAGKVKKIELQPEFILLHAENGKQAVKYIADFLVTYADGRQEVIDVKGYKTAVYKLKKRWFENKYGIEIKEIER